MSKLSIGFSPYYMYVLCRYYTMQFTKRSLDDSIRVVALSGNVKALHADAVLCVCLQVADDVLCLRWAQDRLLVVAVAR